MCLVLIAVERHFDYPLIIASNRDEFYHRPTTPLGFWKGFPGILAGRDEQAGGTWLGVTRQGRVGAITNFREPLRADPEAPSRGRLVSDFLSGELSPDVYFRDKAVDMERCNGFNLIIGNGRELWYYSNRRPGGDGPSRIVPGVHGLSNHFLNTPWPKVRRAKAALSELAATPGRVSHRDILDLLRDRSMPPDDQLPDTGVGLEWERQLSPIFIRSQHYGTRSSTVVTIDREDMARVTEAVHVPSEDGRMISTVRTEAFQIKQ